MCSWSREKLRIIDKEFLALRHKKDSSISIFETVQNVWNINIFQPISMFQNLFAIFLIQKFHYFPILVYNSMSVNPIQLAQFTCFSKIGMMCSFSTISLWYWMVFRKFVRVLLHFVKLFFNSIHCLICILQVRTIWKNYWIIFYKRNLIFQVFIFLF